MTELRYSEQYPLRKGAKIQDILAEIGDENKKCNLARLSAKALQEFKEWRIRNLNKEVKLEC